MTSNNLEAIEGNMRIETLKDDNGRVYTLVPLARSENYIVVVAGDTTGIYELLQADEDIEVKEETPFKFECRHPDCKAKPTKLDKEEVWKKAQAAAKTFEKPTKETKLRELQDKLVLEKTQWRMALSELIDILLEEEY